MLAYTQRTTRSAASFFGKLRLAVFLTLLEPVMIVLAILLPIIEINQLVR